MNLGQEITERLNTMRLAENVKPNGKDSGYVIEEENDSMRLVAEIQDFDKFSCMVKTLSVTRAQAPPAGVSLKELLQRQAGEVERRITYLLESFHLLEVDEFNCLAQVRSARPHKKGEDKFYYEALLQHGNSVTFTRYRKAHHAENRDLVSSHLTQETFERLMDDLAAVLRIA